MRSRTLFLPLVISLLCLLTVTTVNVMCEKSLRMDERKTQLQYAGDMALSVIKEYAALAASGAMLETEARKQALLRINNLHYGETGYFVVFDSNAVLIHPFKPEMVGTSPGAFKGPDGKGVLIDALNAVKKSGAGFTTFLWPKPGRQQPEPKLAYDNGYQPWG